MKKKKVLLYTFYNRWRVSCRAVYEFDVNSLGHIGLEIHKFYYGRFLGLRKILIENNFDYILGIANGSKNSKKIRIEQQFINRYGKNKILNKYKINKVWNPTWKLEVSDKYNDRCIYPDTVTTGPCNRSVVNIQEVIRVNGLNSSVAFIHLQGDISLPETKDFIQFILLNNC